MENHQNFSVGSESSISTVKKGVLWQQQQFEKFHQRIFSRWKKRYFILTTDYLVCFKRSPSKVGHSKMGKFLYKVSSYISIVVSFLWPPPMTHTCTYAVLLWVTGDARTNVFYSVQLLKEKFAKLKITLLDVLNHCIEGQNCFLSRRDDLWFG